MSCWVGVDVGGSRKGFHLAVLGARGDVQLSTARSVEAAVSAIAASSPAAVAIDSPKSTAPAGATARACELELNRRICGIRWTPDETRVSDENNDYYDWIRCGLELYRRLPTDLNVVECFPTASWTRWGGPRGSESRSVWSARVLAERGLTLPAKRLSQDDRDAIGAALTARALDLGEAECIGEIVVPIEVRPEPLRDRLIRRVEIIGGHANVWSLFTDADLFRQVVRALADPFRTSGVTKVVGVESRGFVLGGAVALELSTGFVAVRKEAGLLPGQKEQARTAPDYRGHEHLLRLQRDAIRPGDVVLLVDDWVEVGAQATTARELVERCGATWLGVSVIVDQLPPDRTPQLGQYEALVRADELAWAST